MEPPTRGRVKQSGIAPDLPHFTRKQVIFGVDGSAMLNHVIMIGKFMIAKKAFLSTDVLFSKLLTDKQTEMVIAFNLNKEREYMGKWEEIEQVLESDRDQIEADAE